VGREAIETANRVVIKLGTRVLTKKDNSLADSVLRSIVTQAARLAKSNKEIIVVSSGAIALGLSRMRLKKRPADITVLQAVASLGQSRLMHAYENEFAGCGYETAQILLTYEDIQNRKRYLNVRNTIFALWSFGAIPIVNENDAVSFSEIRFGDNDLLAAYLANMIDADLLVLLTDIDGLYEQNPKKNPESRLLSEIKRIDERVLQSAEGKGSLFSSGGMESKLKAARIATKAGIGAVIASGRSCDLEKILGGEEIGTYFPPALRKMKGKKRWIAFSPNTAGRIVIDGGGERAIVRDKKSLLPAGVREVFGPFPMGSNVSIENEAYVEIARGLSNFSSEEIGAIKGMNSKRIPQILGSDTYFEEVVHRDNMVILG